MDIRIKDNFDLDFSGGGLTFIGPPESVSQNLSIRFNFFKGSWFLNPEIGIPWVQSILGFKVSESFLRSIFRSAVATTPGVTRINFIDINLDGKTRKLSSNISANVVGRDTPLIYDREFIV